MTTTQYSGQAYQFNAPVTLAADPTAALQAATKQYVDARASINTTLTTTSTAANQVIASLSTTLYRSVKFIIQGVNATGTKYHAAEILAVHNGTTVDYIEYGAIQVGGITGTFSVDINGGNLRLLVTPASTNSTVFKATCNTIAV